MLQDVKDAVGGSWVIVFMDDNGIFLLSWFYYYEFSFLLLWV